MVLNAMALAAASQGLAGVRDEEASMCAYAPVRVHEFVGLGLRDSAEPRELIGVVVGQALDPMLQSPRST